MTIKWNTNNDHSNADYDVGGEIIYNTDVLTSNICDFNDAYISVRGDITIIEHRVTQVVFKNYTPFTGSITKSNGTTMDDAEDLNLEYSSNYSETTGILWFCSKDKATNLMLILLIY